MAVRNILVFGYGAMTSAMVGGWLRAGLPASSITAYNPRPKPVPDGVRLVTEIPAGGFDLVVLGFKPQLLGEIAPAMQDVIEGAIVLSVLAGMELATLEASFPGAAGWVRFVPNLAATLGKSPNALAARGLGERGREQVTQLAAMLGNAEWIADESQFDLVTALTASGPAFVYRFIDALAAAAAELGLESEQARRLATSMVEGAAALAAQTDVPPGELARRVASPGGMTQKGLDVLDADGALAALIADCLRAARDRAAEMGAAARPND